MNNRNNLFRTAAAVVIVLSVCAVQISAQEMKGEERDLSIESLLDRFESLEETLPALEVDSNEDGRTDYLVKTLAESGAKRMEILDFNHDGLMDDFYFYQEGILVERAIDSNYDGMVDVWVYIEEGVYIAYYERDNDYDGRMDELKRYTESRDDER